MRIRVIPPRPPSQSHHGNSSSSYQNPLNPIVQIPKPAIDAPSQNSKHNRLMERFKQAVFDLAGPLSPEKISLIERRLLELNPVSITAPSHPTYAAMILRALTELNEEGGSNEIRISEFIRAEYNDLPWAHSRLLRHHLVMLCENGEISVSSSGFYHILSSEGVTSESELEEESEPEGPKKLMWREPWNQRRETKKCQMLKKVRKGKKRKEGVELIKGGSLKRKKKGQETENAAYEGKSVAGKIKVAGEDNQRSRRSSRLRHKDVVDDGNQKPARPRMTQCKDSPVNKEIEQDGMEKHYNKRKQCQKGRQIHLETPLVVEGKDHGRIIEDCIERRKMRRKRERAVKCEENIEVEESERKQIKLELVEVKEGDLGEGNNEATEEQNQGSEIIEYVEDCQQGKEFVEVQNGDSTGPIIVVENQQLREASCEDGSVDVFFDCRGESPVIVMEGEKNEVLELSQTECLFESIKQAALYRDEGFDYKNQAEQDNLAVLVENNAELGQQQSTNSGYSKKEVPVTEVVKLVSSQEQQQKPLEDSVVVFFDRPNNLKEVELKQSQLSGRSFLLVNHPIDAASLSQEEQKRVDISSEQIAVAYLQESGTTLLESLLTVQESSRSEQHKKVTGENQQQRHEDDNEQQDSPPPGRGRHPLELLNLGTSRGQPLHEDSNEQHELLPPQQERLPTTIPDAETTEGEEKQWKTRRRGPPKPNLEAEESAHKSVSSDNHHSDKQQQPFKRRGRPPKAKVKEDKTDCMLQSGHLKIEKEQQQSLSRQRGRPPKHKLSTAASDLMLLEQGNELKQQEQSQGRRRGRPPKQKTSTTAGELVLLPQENELPLQQQQPGQGGQPEHELATSENEQYQQPPKGRGRGRGRGRPRKQTSARTSGEIIFSLPEKEQQEASRGRGHGLGGGRGRSRGRGRPCKPKLANSSQLLLTLQEEGQCQRNLVGEEGLISPNQ